MLRALLAFAAVLSAWASACFAQAPDPSTTEFDTALNRVRTTQAEVERYRQVCNDIKTLKPGSRAPSGSLLADFAQDELFINAISSMCAFGDFVFDASDPAGKCTKKRVLGEKHIDFVRKIAQVKTETPLRLFQLTCVQIAEPLVIRNLNADGFVLKDVLAERVMLAFAKVSVEIILENSEFSSGFVVYASEVGGALRLNESTFGNNSTWGYALGAEAATFGEILLNGITSRGAVKFARIVVARQFSISKRNEKRSTIEGYLDLSYARIGSQLDLSNATVNANAYLGYVSAFGLSMANATFKERVFLGNAKFDRDVEINKSDLHKGLSARFTEVPEFAVRTAGLGGTLDFRGARLTSLVVSDAKPLAKDCTDCIVQMFNAGIGNLRIQDSNLEKLLAGNGRFNTFTVDGGTLRTLNCEDCLIDQYALLSTKVLDRAELGGLEIKGTLAFSEGTSKSLWAKTAFLDMAGLKADIIAANARDLQVESEPSSDPKKPNPPSFVTARLTGAKYRIITSGRESMKVNAQQVSRGNAITDIDKRALVDFLRQYRKAAGIGYDPQPFEEMALALARSGDTENAIALRVARIDDRMTGTNVGWLERGWYAVYRLLSDYGYKNERVALLFLGLLALGMGVHLFGQGFGTVASIVQCHKSELFGCIVYSLWYSLDRAIPPLNLELLRQQDKGLSWGVANYFYLHRVIGTSLISVFAAGAAGLGQ